MPAGVFCRRFIAPFDPRDAADADAAEAVGQYRFGAAVGSDHRGQVIPCAGVDRSAIAEADGGGARPLTVDGGEEEEGHDGIDLEVAVVFEVAEVVVPRQHIHAMLCFWIRLDQSIFFLDNMYACLNFVCLRCLQNDVKKI
jgi:hypothetical protein